jgi:hypothetical protein
MLCVEMMIRLGVHSTWVVKGNTRLFPKKQLLAILRARHSYARGNWVVMSTEVAGVKLMAIAYAWSTKGVSYFVTDNGDTRPGTPYTAAFEEDSGGVGTALLPRPAVCSFVYKLLPLIDEHNRQRQHFYDMASSWPTACPWFRLLSEAMGMCMVDLYYLMRNKLPDTYVGMGIVTFADRVCASLKVRVRNAPAHVPIGSIPLVSLRDIADRYDEQGGVEQASKLVRTDSGRRARPQRQCRVCNNYYKSRVDTSYGCARCEFAVCGEDRSSARYDPTRIASCQMEHNESCTGIPTYTTPRLTAPTPDDRMDMHPWNRRASEDGAGPAEP